MIRLVLTGECQILNGFEGVKTSDRNVVVCDFLFAAPNCALACNAGVLLVRANAKSSRSFVRPAIFDLQLEWTVGVGGGVGEKRKKNISMHSIVISTMITEK